MPSVKTNNNLRIIRINFLQLQQDTPLAEVNRLKYQKTTDIWKENHQEDFFPSSPPEECE